MDARLVRFLPRGSVVLALTTLGSYILGLLRDRIFAHTFGAAAALDSYNAAFLVPDFLFNLLVASGIAAAAVPLFIELGSRSRQEAEEYIDALIVAAVSVMAIVAMLVMVFAPAFSILVAPGLDGEARMQVIQLMRLLALSPLLFAASNALGAMLVARQRFLFYGLSPLLYNLGIIVGALLLAPHVGIIGVVWGTLLGAVLHFLTRFIGAFLTGWRWRWVWGWNLPAMRRTVRLMLPKMAGHPVESLTFWMFTSMASFLAPGSITVLNFARNFQSVPVSLIGIAVSTAAFPLLARAALVSRQEVRSVFWRVAASILGVSCLAALAVFFSRHQLVTVLLGGGAFQEAAIAQTALVLGVFCLSIPTESVSHLLARAFYAQQNTVMPVAWSVASLVVAVGSAFYLTQTMGIVGLPIGFFLGSFAKTAGLAAMFTRQR